MKLALIGTAAIVAMASIYAGSGIGSAVPADTGISRSAPEAALAPPEDTVVDNRYVVPGLPPDVVARLPAAAATADHYLSQRIELAELVVGEHIPAAEDLANRYARDIPGFQAVLLADGFRRDEDGSWYYDRFASWMRFPLNQ